MSDDLDLNAVIDAWAVLSPEARRTLAQLAHDFCPPENAIAAGPWPTLMTEPECETPAEAELLHGAWPTFVPSSEWERHDDPEVRR